MKVISQKLKEHLEHSTSEVATLWKFELLNGDVLGFTDHEKDLKIEGIKYFANPGLTSNTTTTTLGLKPDYMYFSGLIDGSHFKKEELLSGQYDNAQVTVFKTTYNNIKDGVIPIFKGHLGKIRIKGAKFEARIASLVEKLENTVLQLYSAKCRAKFGDSKCKMNLTPLMKNGVIESIIDDNVIFDSKRNEKDGFFDGGILMLTSGKNSGNAICSQTI